MALLLTSLVVSFHGSGIVVTYRHSSFSRICNLKDIFNIGHPIPGKNSEAVSNMPRGCEIECGNSCTFFLRKWSILLAVRKIMHHTKRTLSQSAHQFMLLIL